MQNLPDTSQNNTALLLEALSQAADFRSVLELILASSDAQSSMPVRDSELLWETCSLLARQALQRPIVARFPSDTPATDPAEPADPPCLTWKRRPVIAPHQSHHLAHKS